VIDDLRPDPLQQRPNLRAIGNIERMKQTVSLRLRGKIAGTHYLITTFSEVIDKVAANESTSANDKSSHRFRTEKGSP
jgi:hypothetical protein